MFKQILLVAFLASAVLGQDWAMDINPVMIGPRVFEGQDILVPVHDTLLADSYFIDTLRFVDACWAGPAEITNWMILEDSCSVGEVKHDTLKEYISEIVERCDTTFKKIWMPAGRFDGVEYFKRIAVVDTIKVWPDTVWADKIPVYLKPEEYENLKLLLRKENK